MYVARVGATCSESVPIGIVRAWRYFTMMFPMQLRAPEPSFTRSQRSMAPPQADQPERVHFGGEDGMGPLWVLKLLPLEFAKQGE